MAHFKRATLGKPVLMGRRTFASLARALPGRTNVVLSRAAEFTAAGALVAHDLDAGLALVARAAEVVVIRGGPPFPPTPPRAPRLYPNPVHARAPGDPRVP